MYSFEEFKALTVSHLEQELKKQDDRISVFTCPARKINQELTAVSYEIEGVRNGIRPTVYLEPMYEAYLRAGDVDEVLNHTVSLMTHAAENETDYFAERLMNYESASDRIVFQLINTEQNTELLGELPHRAFQDLSVVYRWIVDKNENGISSVQIDNRLAETMGFSEQELYELAYENTRRILQPEIISMADILAGLGCELTEEERADAGIYVVSNRILNDGAAMILYSDIMGELNKKIGSDFYLLPSSRHEFLAVAEDEILTPEFLQTMVHEINLSQVRPEDRLSNQVYRYDSSTQQIRQVTFDEHTRLDEDLPAWAGNNEQQDESEEHEVTEVEAPVMQM